MLSFTADSCHEKAVLSNERFRSGTVEQRAYWTETRLFRKVAMDCVTGCMLGSFQKMFSLRSTLIVNDLYPDGKFVSSKDIHLYAYKIDFFVCLD